MKGPNTETKTDDGDNLVKEVIMQEKNLDEEVLKKNKEKITSVRFYSAILAGIFAGIFALSGLMGFCFYLVNYVFATLIIFAHSLISKKGNYFPSIASHLSAGLFDHGMVYMIFWVMFYNLVHIYG